MKNLDSKYSYSRDDNGVFHLYRPHSLPCCQSEIQAAPHSKQMLPRNKQWNIEAIGILLTAVGTRARC